MLRSMLVYARGAAIVLWLGIFLMLGQALGWQAGSSALLRCGVNQGCLYEQMPTPLRWMLPQPEVSAYVEPSLQDPPPSEAI